MNFGEHASYYELLEVSRQASAREIHEAYLRIKAAYSDGSLALYSLISAEERDQTLRDIEQAYRVLSDELQRTRYDATLQAELLAPGHVDNPFGTDVVSIDRVPPMDLGAGDEILIPPALESARSSGGQTNPDSGSFAQTSLRPFQAPQPGMHSTGPQERSSQPGPDLELKQLIAQEIEWKGALLRKIRELRGFSVEDMCTLTRLSKTYLNAIEAEDFKKLPAPVFVRGFVVQICKTLKLPHDRAAAAYMARCYQARKEA